MSAFLDGFTDELIKTSGGLQRLKRMERALAKGKKSPELVKKVKGARFKEDFRNAAKSRKIDEQLAAKTDTTLPPWDAWRKHRP